jgi:hypothetical protein
MSEVNEAYPPPPCSASVPDWVAEEIKATWRAARDAGGEMAAFRIIERMVDRLGSWAKEKQSFSGAEP